jgi:hypothetical protein
MSVLTGAPAVPGASGRTRLDATAVACGVASVGAIVAALTHLWVIPEHLAEWPPAAVFFAVLTVLQLGLAWLVRRRPAPAVVLLGLAGTVGLVIFYVATRTLDLPFLPAHGAEHLPVAWGVGNGIPVFPGDRIEEVGVADVVCLVAELATVAALVALTTSGVRRLLTNALLGLGILMLVLRVGGVLG